MSTPRGPEGHHDLEIRLRTVLHDASAGVDTAGLDLDTVRRRGRRRRRAGRTLVAACSVTALVGVGVLAAQTLGDRGDEGLTLSSPTTTLATTETGRNDDGPAGETNGDAAADGSVAVPTTELPTPTTGTGSSTTVDTSVQDPGAQVVAWGDGFLRVWTSYGPQRLEPMADDVVALFPPEVVEFFEGRFPATIAEGLEMLADRPDLLAEIQRVMAEHPEAARALQGVSDPGQVVVERSGDGVTWSTAGTLALPEGMDGIGFAAADGDHLVIAGSTWGAGPDGTATAAVAATRDFQQWDVVQPLPAVEDSVSAGERRDLNIAGVDVGPAGVVVAVNEVVQPEIEWFLPDDVRRQLEDGRAYSVTTTDTGVVIELFDQDSTSVGDDGDDFTDFSTSEAVATYEFTYDELGVDPRRGLEPTQRLSVWAGDLGAGLVRLPVLDETGWASFVAAADDGSVIVATTGNRGVRIWQTIDRATWLDRTPTFVDQGWLAGFTDTPAGALLVLDTGAGLEHWSSDASLQGWSQVEVGAVPEGRYGWLTTAASGPAGTALLYSVEQGPGPDSGLGLVVPIDRDGYRMTVTFSGRVQSVVVVRVGVDGAPDDVLYEFGGGTFVPPDGVVYGPGGNVTVLDPETGDELVTFTSEDFEAAYDAANPDGEVWDEPTTEYLPPTFVLMWSSDGVTWQELDRIEQEPWSTGSGPGPDELWPSSLVVGVDRVLMTVVGGSTVEVRTYEP